MAFDFNSLTQASNLFANINNFQKHEIITVNSLQQAKDFSLTKGDSYLLLDPNSDLLYIKEMDNIGKISLRVYSITEVTEQYINNSTPATISKTEYEKLLKRLETLEVQNAVKKSDQLELGL